MKQRLGFTKKSETDAPSPPEGNDEYTFGHDRLEEDHHHRAKHKRPQTGKIVST